MILGILGGIGAGKSTVTSLLEQQGARTIDADRLAHEILDSPEVREELRSWLGEKVLTADGSVDRRLVADHVFSNAEALKRLESLIHPRVRERIGAEVEAFRREVAARPAGPAESKGSAADVLVLDVPLLLGTPLEDLCDRLVFVDASRESREARVSTRGWDAEELSRREAQQLSIDEKKQRADHRIGNSGSLEDTARQIATLLSVR